MNINSKNHNYLVFASVCVITALFSFGFWVLTSGCSRSDENYAFTLASMSPCVKSGKLDCVYCHTSSGRYRFAKENPNGACVECHAKRVENITAHSHHSSEGKAGQCISCHMPTTSFAKMRRYDHSMRPPSPEASRLYGSQSACIICHSTKKEGWAASFVKRWHPGSSWQTRIVYEGGLVDAATQELLKEGEGEVMEMFRAIPDFWSSFYNKGNYMLERGDPVGAMDSYKISIKLRPDVVISYVNAAVRASYQGNLGESIEYLKLAQKIEPENGVVNMNLGLALAESGDREGSFKC